MSTPGRPMQRLYTIDGEPGWTVQRVANRVCTPGSGLTYNLIGKRLLAGANTWAALSRPTRCLKHRNRPANPRPNWKPRTVEELARYHVEDIESQRNRLLIAWRGPISPCQLVARINPARPANALEAAGPVAPEDGIETAAARGNGLCGATP